jgi:hypothetical protein
MTQNSPRRAAETHLTWGGDWFSSPVRIDSMCSNAIPVRRAILLRRRRRRNGRRHQLHARGLDQARSRNQIRPPLRQGRRSRKKAAYVIRLSLLRKPPQVTYRRRFRRGPPSSVGLKGPGKKRLWRRCNSEAGAARESRTTPSYPSISGASALGRRNPWLSGVGPLSERESGDRVGRCGAEFAG